MSFARPVYHRGWGTSYPRGEMSGGENCPGGCPTIIAQVSSTWSKLGIVYRLFEQESQAVGGDVRNAMWLHHGSLIWNPFSQLRIIINYLMAWTMEITVNSFETGLVAIEELRREYDWMVMYCIVIQCERSHWRWQSNIDPRSLRITHTTENEELEFAFPKQSTFFRSV